VFFLKKIFLFERVQRNRDPSFLSAFPGHIAQQAVVEEDRLESVFHIEPGSERDPEKSKVHAQQKETVVTV